MAMELIMSPSSQSDNILLTSLLSRLLCGQGPQATCIINIVLSVLLLDGNWNAVIFNVVFT